jgi:phosphoribosylformylglycinamidine synthase
MQFICKNLYIRSDDSGPLQIPIAHGEGRYFADDKTLDQLEANNQVLYRYCDENGNITAESNPNGAIRNIAGIANAQGNVFGMMPHPERACSIALGNTDGVAVFKSLILKDVPELV